MEINKVYNEDCRNTIDKMPDEFFQMAVTSPPYDGMRTYTGCDWNLEIALDIIGRLSRVVKKGGVVVWIVNDATEKFSESGNSMRHALHFMETGFGLFDHMVYEKPARPRGSNLGYHQVWEHMFVFSKGKPSHGKLIEDRRNNDAQSMTSASRKPNGDFRVEKVKYKQFGRRTNVWKYNVGYNKSAAEDIAYKHPAIYPEKLAEDHILSWSNVGDLVYDPFMGSGTTAKMAKKNGRDYIGSEISEEYCQNIEQRLAMNIDDDKKGLIW